MPLNYDTRAGEPIPSGQIAAVKMGTTVATNALLERKGDRTLLVTNKGLKDALRIAYQARPNIFARQIVLPELLYERVAEVERKQNFSGQGLGGRGFVPKSNGRKVGVKM